MPEEYRIRFRKRVALTYCYYFFYADSICAA